MSAFTQTEDAAAVQIDRSSFPKWTKKRKPGSRHWLVVDERGGSEMLDLDKHAVTKRVAVPSRDLRVLGPLFSQAAAILARDRAMLVNLEHIKAIVTAEEVLILNPMDEEVVIFVERLKSLLQQSAVASPFMQSPIPDMYSSDFNFFMNPTKGMNPTKDISIETEGDAVDSSQCLTSGHTLNEVPGKEELDEELEVPKMESGEAEVETLPFEFRVLELILETVLHHLEKSTRLLLADANPAMEEFTKSVSTESLERVRNVKSRMTRLTARVQTVREELEQLLDDDGDMHDLYLTRKSQQQSVSVKFPDSPGALSFAKGVDFSVLAGSLDSLGSEGAGGYDVEDLEMLLEAYFMQVDGTLNKLNTLREYIDDTEDYVNIELDHRRNKLIEFQVQLGTANCVIALSLIFVGAGGMNVPFWMYELPNQFGFNVFVWTVISACLSVYIGMQIYFRRSRLLGL